MHRLALAGAVPRALPAAAQLPAVPPPPNSGTLVIMTGSAEIELPNDEAVANFFYEAQDADLTKAQALVNQRVGEGTAALKRADPKAQIETSGYGSYPVYAGGANRSIVGWRVRQGVTLRTDNLAVLPKTVAAAQSTLSVGWHGLPAVEGRTREGRGATDPAGHRQPERTRGRGGAGPGRAGRTACVWRRSTSAGARAAPSRSALPRMATMASDAVPPPTFEAGRSAERLMSAGRPGCCPSAGRRTSAVPRCIEHARGSDTIESHFDRGSIVELSASPSGARRLAFHRGRCCCSRLLVLWFAGFAWSLPLWLVAGFVIQFFRDPPREVPVARRRRCFRRPMAASSRCSKVHDALTQRETLLISVFMNVFNVHSNRSPVDGTVESVQVLARQLRQCRSRQGVDRERAQCDGDAARLR